MTDQRVAEVLVELVDTLVADFDVVEFLQSLTEKCVELLGVTATGVVLADDRGRYEPVAGSPATTRGLELLERQRDGGPCVDALATGAPVLDVSTSAATRRWPVFARAATEGGVRTTSVLPMLLHGHVVGALNIFSDRHGSMRATSLALGQAMADVATLGLLNARPARERTPLSEQLQHALDSRVVIEQAKGVLAARAGTDVHEAFTRLRQHARDSRSPLTSVAAAVVAGELRLDVVSPAAAPGPTEPSRLPPGTTPLELRLLRLLSQGLAVSDAADQLGLPMGPVASRLADLRQRFSVDSTAAVLREARNADLI